MNTDTKSQPATFYLPAILGTIAGLVIGRYSGIFLVIPLLGAVIASWVLRKLLPDAKQNVVPAFAVQSGHFVWLAFGLTLTGQLLTVNSLDLVIYLAGLSWLLLSRQTGPLILLGLYQVVSIVINAIDFSAVEIGTITHKALLVHLVFRILAVVFLVVLFTRYRKRDREADV